MSELTISDWLTDLGMNLARLQGIVEEVEQHIADGNLDSAALVLGSQTGKVARFQDSYAGLQAKLRDEGASAERALRRRS